MFMNFTDRSKSRVNLSKIKFLGKGSVLVDEEKHKYDHYIIAYDFYGDGVRYMYDTAKARNKDYEDADLFIPPTWVSRNRFKG